MKFFRRMVALGGGPALFALIGFLIGFPVSLLTYSMYDSGYLSHWERGAAAPAGTVEIVTNRGGALYIRTENGVIYREPVREIEDGWVISSLPAADSGSGYMKWDEVHPCRRDGVDFSLLSGAPGEIVDCLHVEVAHFEGGWQTTYVLDKNGRLWEWNVNNSGYAGLLFFILGFFGSVFLGVLYGLALTVRNMLADHFAGEKSRLLLGWRRLPSILRYWIGGIAVGGVCAVISTCYFGMGSVLLLSFCFGLIGSVFGLVGGLLLHGKEA